MSRLIDANQIKLTSESFCDADGEILVPLSEVRKAIALVTPLIDVVNGVRCIDCKYAHDFNKENECWCDYWDSTTDGDGYCRQGEKRINKIINVLRFK